MHLDKLHITTFRCFTDYEIEFAPGVTILFGKNGAGKSTLIHAIQIQTLFDKAWRLISDKDISHAKIVVEELERLTPSDQSELVKLRSMIKRLEVIGR